MPSFFSAAILTTSVLLLSAWTTSGQPVSSQRTWTATPFLHTSAGIADSVGTNDPLVANSMGLGVAVGYDWTPRLGFEGEVSYLTDVAGNAPDINWSIGNFSANAVYHVDVRQVTPYATLGLGFARNRHVLKGAGVTDLSFRDRLIALGLDIRQSVASISNEVAFNAGGGIKYAMTDRVAARIDFRRFQYADIAPNHWRLYGGITFALTGR
jgi:opacity protein-like surface antigen